MGLLWLVRAAAHRQLRNQWLPFLAVAAGVSVLAGIVQRLLAPGYSVLDWFYTRTGADGLPDVPAALLRVAWRLIRFELLNLTVDVPLLIICLVAAIGLIQRLRTELAQLTIGVLAGTFILNLLNTEPSNFRYNAMVFPLLAVVAVDTVAAWVGAAPQPVVAPRIPDQIPQVRASSSV